MYGFFGIIDYFSGHRIIKFKMTGPVWRLPRNDFIVHYIILTKMGVQVFLGSLDYDSDIRFTKLKLALSDAGHLWGREGK